MTLKEKVKFFHSQGMVDSEIAKIMKMKEHQVSYLRGRVLGLPSNRSESDVGLLRWKHRQRKERDKSRSIGFDVPKVTYARILELFKRHEELTVRQITSMLGWTSQTSMRVYLEEMVESEYLRSHGHYRKIYTPTGLGEL